MGLGATTILTGGFERCTPRWDRTTFKHESYAKFYLVTAGSAVYENEWGVTALTAGNLYFLPPHQGSRHTCARLMDVYWMHFSIDAAILDMRLTRLRTVRSWPIGRWAQHQALFERLPEYVAHPQLELELRVQAMIMELCAGLLADNPESRDEELERLRERLQPAVDRLDAQFKEPPPLPQLALACGLSVPHFHRGFRTAFHTTPYRYMLRRRMDLAHQLLCNTAMPVGAVGEAIGYADPFYFSRVFKRYYQRSPERFRAEQRRGP